MYFIGVVKNDMKCFNLMVICGISVLCVEGRVIRLVFIIEFLLDGWFCYGYFIYFVVDWMDGVFLRKSY